MEVKKDPTYIGTVTLSDGTDVVMRMPQFGAMWKRILSGQHHAEAMLEEATGLSWEHICQLPMTDGFKLVNMMTSATETAGANLWQMQTKGGVN